MTDRRIALEKALRPVPLHTCRITYAEDASPMTHHVTIRTEGKGIANIVRLFPGIDLSYWQILAPSVSFSHESSHDALELTFCRSGRAGWTLKNGLVSYIGAGATSAHTMDCCAQSAMSLPLGYFEGVSLAIHLPMLPDICLDIMHSAGSSANKLLHKYGTIPVVLPPDPETDRIFSSMYDTPEPFQLAACKLAALELLLYLIRADIRIHAAQPVCDTHQAELIQEIHDVMTTNLDKRYTIEELAKAYFINTSSLKAAFKAVYGLPIAAYMRSYRIRQSMKLLQMTDDSIAAISAAVGYETQGKFTKAFKDATQLLPREYRKKYRNG